MIHQCCVAWMVMTWRFNGFVAESEKSRPVMLWEVLLVLVCFTVVLTTCCTCLPTTRSMVRRWILFISVTFGISASQ